MGETSSTRGRISVRSVQNDGDDGATTTATTTTTTSSTTATVSEKLRALLAAVPDRGVYGLPSEQKEAILLAIAELEELDGGGLENAKNSSSSSPSSSSSSSSSPSSSSSTSVSARLPALAGRWRVLFSTVTITGSKRVKLGLKSAVTLGDLTQTIDPDARTATNEVAFELRFLGGRGGRGSLRLEARFAVAGADHPRRVDISLSSAALTPPALDSLLGQHMDLLLSIFNPEGWLETTFADERLRVGRDDKGRVFVLERVVS